MQDRIRGVDSLLFALEVAEESKSRIGVPKRFTYTMREPEFQFTITGQHGSDEFHLFRERFVWRIERHLKRAKKEINLQNERG